MRAIILNGVVALYLIGLQARRSGFGGEISWRTLVRLIFDLFGILYLLVKISPID